MAKRIVDLAANTGIVSTDIFEKSNSTGSTPSEKVTAAAIAASVVALAPVQAVNTFYGGPVSGSPATPTFRLIDKLMNSGGTVVSIDNFGFTLNNATGQIMADYDGGLLIDNGGFSAMLWSGGARELYDNAGNLAQRFTVTERWLAADDGLTVNIDYTDNNNLYLGPTGNARLKIVGGGASTVLLEVDSPDPNAAITMQTNGAGSYDLTSGTCTLLFINNQASAVNGFQMLASTTGNSVVLSPSVTGDANTPILIQSKGTAAVKIGAAELNYPNADGAANSVMTTDGAGTLSLQPAQFAKIPTTVIGVGGPTQMSSNNAYVASSSSPIAVFVLPVSPALGDIVELSGYGGAGWQINIGTAAMLRVGNSAALANIQSSSQWDCITLKAVQTASGGQWTAISVIGNITIN